jgi:hypothetical protein
VQTAFFRSSRCKWSVRKVADTRTPIDTYKKPSSALIFQESSSDKKEGGVDHLLSFDTTPTKNCHPVHNIPPPVKFRIEPRAAQKEQVRPLLARMRRVGPANGERSTATGGHRICTVIRRHRCFWKTTPLSFVTGRSRGINYGIASAEG